VSAPTLKALISYHGGISSSPDYVVGKSLTETQRFEAVPLIFRLIPSKALEGAGGLILVKPMIRDHLSKLGFGADEALIDCMKLVVDQYARYLRSESRQDTKWGMRELRGTQHYRRLMTAQASRCPVCGVRLERSGNESLDHIVPFNLIGDTMTGENWSIMCASCNSGKTHWLSALQSAYATGWLYGQRTPSLQKMHPETRYAALALSGKCMVSGCAKTPRDGELLVRRKSETGLWVMGNLAVVCGEHDARAVIGEAIAPRLSAVL
jgi:hypothetical protein